MNPHGAPMMVCQASVTVSLELKGIKNDWPIMLVAEGIPARKKYVAVMRDTRDALHVKNILGACVPFRDSLGIQVIPSRDPCDSLEVPKGLHKESLGIQVLFREIPEDRLVPFVTDSFGRPHGAVLIQELHGFGICRSSDALLP